MNRQILPEDERLTRSTFVMLSPREHREVAQLAQAERRTVSATIRLAVLQALKTGGASAT